MTVPTISTSSLPVQSWLWKSYKNSPLPKQLVTTIFLSALNFKDGIIADSFANFFNTSICDRWFSPWKYGQVTPVLKKGGENLKSNYLPIAMLAAFNTVFERILSTVLISISQVLQLTVRNMQTWMALISRRHLTALPMSYCYLAKPKAHGLLENSVTSWPATSDGKDWWCLLQLAISSYVRAPRVCSRFLCSPFAPRLHTSSKIRFSAYYKHSLPFPPKQCWFFYFFDSADHVYTTLNWGPGYQRINAGCK